MSRHRALPLLVLLLAAACDEPTRPDPTPPAGSPAPLPVQALLAEEGVPSLDAEWIRIAREVEGFGGAYYDERGDLNIVLVDPRQEDRARAALDSIGRIPVVADREAGTGRYPEMVVVRGRYDFARLAAWRDRALPVVLTEGVVYLDADEVNNAVTVAVGSREVEPVVRRQLAELGVPEEAVRVEVREPVRPLATLRDWNRPTEGGLQIARPVGAFGAAICTLGFNALRAGREGFVTNSHCTSSFAAPDGSPFDQPWRHVFAANLLGSEVADPFAFSNRSGCPAGARCRRSDAAFVAYNSGVIFLRGFIARTRFWGNASGSLEINPADRRFAIMTERSFPLAGTMLEKMGRTTGWTWGFVGATCVTTGVQGTSLVLVCQDNVDRPAGLSAGAGSGPGDSGSPVFRWGFCDEKGCELMRGRVELHGVLWGGPTSGSGWIFSSMGNIRSELGALATR